MTRPLEEFIRYADLARSTLTPGTVDWSVSPYAWMRSNGPRTKSKLGKEIVMEWLKERNTSFGLPRADEDHHLTIGGARFTIHLALQGKEGKLEFAMLREPGYGVDGLLLVGVEPLRVRIWRVKSVDVADLPRYKRDAVGFHNLTLSPDDIPAWCLEVSRWESL